MNITIIGAGNSGLAMAAHLGQNGHRISLWNRSKSNIAQLIKTHEVHSEGVVNGVIKLALVTDNLKEALKDTDLVLITTPADSHKELARKIAKAIEKETTIILNPGRTFGALEFQNVYEKYNTTLKQKVAEAQTIIYTCRKAGENSVNIVAFKSDVYLSTFNANDNRRLILDLPVCLQKYFVPAQSMIETSLGNVGMILHCAPLLLNAGWTENEKNCFKYYYDGITPTVANFVEKIDAERVAVSETVGHKVESTKEWLIRTYGVTGDNLFECIQNNNAYKTIDAPKTLKHRYIYEDVPNGLVPLESLGLGLGANMRHTSLIIDLASSLMDIDFRCIGRTLESVGLSISNDGRVVCQKGE